MDASKFDKEAVRVYRGGSWYSTAGDARAADRYGVSPGYRFSFLGFRLCLCRDLFYAPAESVPTLTPRNEDAQES